MSIQPKLVLDAFVLDQAVNLLSKGAWPLSAEGHQLPRQWMQTESMAQGTGRSVLLDSSASDLPMATTSNPGGSFLSSDSSGLSGLQNTSSPLRLPADAMTALQQEDMSGVIACSTRHSIADLAQKDLSTPLDLVGQAW